MIDSIFLDKHGHPPTSYLNLGVVGSIPALGELLLIFFHLHVGKGTCIILHSFVSIFLHRLLATERNNCLLYLIKLADKVHGATQIM